jgi:hypothetical protein
MKFRLQLCDMHLAEILKRHGMTSGWTVELGLALIGLLVGGGLMPILIFFVGVSLLGRYEGASLGHTFSALYGGLVHGSIASWVVFLGPYGLYLLFMGLRTWWRAGAEPG